MVTRPDPVAVRLPADVLEGLDAVAGALDRSRSWVVVRALRAYLAAEGRQILELAAGHKEVAGDDLVDGETVLRMLREDPVLIGGKLG